MKCEEYVDRFLRNTHSQFGDQEAWEQHLTVCPFCQSQEQVHRVLLETLSPRPELDFSAQFESLMRKRISVRHLTSPLSHRARALLAIYLTAFLLTTIWILGSINWSLVTLPETAQALILFAALVSPFLAFHWSSPLESPKNL